MKLLPLNNHYKKILQLALPAIAGLSTQMIVTLVDTAMVGRLPDAKYALAAMGIGMLATWALVSFFSSLATGTHILVARRFGNQDTDGCGEVLRTSIFFAFMIGVVITLIGIFASTPIALFFAADDTVGYYAGEYIFFRFLGLPFFLAAVSYRGFYFGVGKTKIFMISGVLVNLLNIIFNYTFIYGAFGAPKMGLAGAGLGSSLATFCDAIFYTSVIMLPYYRTRFQPFKKFNINKEILTRIVKLALPVSFQNVFILIGFLSFVAITGLIGTREQAATQAIISLLFISFMPCYGFGIAVQTLVGNNLGTGKVTIGKLYGFETAKIATYYTLFIGIIFFFLPEYVLLLTTTDRTIIETAIAPLKVAAIAQIFYATGVVLANGLQSAGKTYFVMAAEVITNLLIYVPLAYFFGIYLELGLVGAWFALPIYIIFYSLSIYLKFTYGDWNNLKKL